MFLVLKYSNHLILLGVLSYYYPYLQSIATGQAINNKNETNYEKEQAFVSEIIDGDTIVVSGDKIGNDIHIRLLGINTPEKKMPYSDDATDFLKRTIENNNIELLRDYTDEDKYKRKLRYVFYENRFVNLEILEQGLATSFMIDGLKNEDKLRKAETSARENKIGMWEESFDECKDCIILEKIDCEKEYFILKNSCDFSCNLTSWFVKDDANHFFKLSILNAFESRTYNSDIDEMKKTKDVWNNEGDRFFMRDGEGRLVVFREVCG